MKWILYSKILLVIIWLYLLIVNTIKPRRIKNKNKKTQYHINDNIK